LHKKFVLGNILQESEFWATRKNLLDDQANKASKQRPGFKTVMSDVRPSADGRTNKVTFNLTTEMIHQVYLSTLLPFYYEPIRIYCSVASFSISSTVIIATLLYYAVK